MINNQLKTKIHMDSIKEIFLIGSIEYSEDELHVIKSTLVKGVTPDFKFPEFNPSKDYINFYQVITNDDKCFMYALSDKKTLKDFDDSLLMIEIKRKLSTMHLPREARYK